jgi:ABC-type transport system substrate-binding protein
MPGTDDNGITLTDRHWTRRELVQDAVLAGGALALASPLLEASARAAELAAPKPVRGGTLEVAFSGSLLGIGTANWGARGFTIGYALFNRLLALTPDGKTIVPELATSLPKVSADGRRYTFQIREGVKFHDGSTLTAADVKYSFERILDPKGPSLARSLYQALGIVGTAEFQAGRAASVTGIRVINRRTVEFNLVAPNSAFPYTLSMTMASIVPRAYTQRIGTNEFEQKPIGTGPYRVASYRPGVSLTLVRFRNYWDKRKPGWVDKVEWQLNADPNLSVLRLQSNELHVMHDPVPAGFLSTLRKSKAQRKNFRVGIANDVFYIATSLAHPAMADVRVRRAIGHAIDKNKIVARLGGIGKPATGGLFSPKSPYFQAGLSPAYDPERARSLLDQANASGFRVTLLAKAVDPDQRIAASIAADLAAVGINVNLSVMPIGAWRTEVFRFGPNLVLSKWELPYPHGSYIMESAFTKASVGVCCNFTGWTSQQFEDMVARARRATGQREQERLYKQMDSMVIRDQALWIPLIYPGYATLKSSKLQGFRVPATPSADMLFFKDYWLSR